MLGLVWIVFPCILTIFQYLFMARLDAGTYVTDTTDV